MMHEEGLRSLVFLLSMPRAGSTLLGLLLGNHPEVCCPPEPWLQLLIADCCSLTGDTQFLFDEQVATLAAGDFIRNARGPAKEDTTLVDAFHKLFSLGVKDESAVDFTHIIYSAFASRAGKSILVDKTPRYYNILGYLDRLFPTEKRIVLRRNPLDIAFSYKTTWGISVAEMVGKSITPATVDFAKGLFELSQYSLSDRPNVFTLAYEDLVEAPAQCVKELTEFLGIDFSSEMLAYQTNIDAIAAQRNSIVGDRNVLRTGRIVDTTSVGKWRAGLSLSEKSELATFLGEGIFRELGYEQVIFDLQNDGVVFPAGCVSEELRSAVLEVCRVSPRTTSQFGTWAYLASSSGASAHTLGGLIEELLQHYGNPEAWQDLIGELVLDMANRYQLSEKDRVMRLNHIETLVGDFKKVDAERVSHLQKIDALKAVLRQTEEEREVLLNSLNQRPM